MVKILILPRVFGHFLRLYTACDTDGGPYFSPNIYIKKQALAHILSASIAIN